jgi:hypothetical protein
LLAGVSQSIIRAELHVDQYLGMLKIVKLVEHTMKDCSCSKRQGNLGEESLEVFGAVRSCCPALHQIFVPDEVWPGFQQWHRQSDTVVCHRSILLLAMERGHLGRVTSAVHRYLIPEGFPKPDVRQQYLQDLRERWMLYSDPKERHQKFRMFAGRLVELQFAEWLESQSWTISGLEALQEGPDIEAYASDSRPAAFEVKFIGTTDSYFAAILESLAGQSALRFPSLHGAANYLLFRVYEAAKQLQRGARDRIAVVVVEELTWPMFRSQLTNSWIDWANPKFFSSGQVWEEFMACQRTRYPDLPNDLQPTLRSLNAVWMLKQSADYQYHREFEFPLNRA